MNDLITKDKVKQIHVLLAKTGLMAYKQDIMDNACIDGRYPTSSKELYNVEADSIITYLNKRLNECDKMRKKVISICMQCGMSVNGRADMAKIYAWVLKYGHAKKAFNDYSYYELIQLITQAQRMYNTFITAVHGK